MTMIQELYEVVEEGTVVSLNEFLQETDWYNAFCKRYPEYHHDNDDFDIYEHISSDMCEIQEILSADHRIWSVDWIEEGDYFLIRQWKKVE